jgi:hypothetical protein
MKECSECGEIKNHAFDCSRKMTVKEFMGPLKGFGVRLDAAKVKEARKLGIDTGRLFRQALEQALLAQRGVCPTCGTEQKRHA